MYVNRLLKEFLLRLLYILIIASFFMENIYAKKKNDFIYVTILNIYINMYIIRFYFQI